MDASSYVSGILFILCGIFFCFSGNRVIRPVLFVAGFFFGSALAYVILTHVEAGAGNSSINLQALYIGVCIGAGVVVGALSIWLVRVGLTLVGLMAGFALGMWIVAWNPVIYSSLAFFICLIVLMLAGAILIHFFETWIFILGTALAGAMSIGLGVDTFAQQGLITYLQAVLAAKSTRAAVSQLTSSNGLMGLLGGIAALFLLGVWVQFENLMPVDHGRGPILGRL